MRRTTSVLATMLLMASCSNSGTDLAEPADGADLADQADQSDSADQSGEADPADQADDIDLVDPAPPSSSPSSDGGTTDGTVLSSAPVSSGSAPTSESPATVPIVEVPATGVPGLDSDDAFCAAWSRFGGSWQVLLVGSSFLGDPERVSTWEIAAAQTIGAAYSDLIDRFPEQLAREVELVAESYFGALLRRSETALSSLRRAGASADDEQQLSAAWLAALAQRDPLDADLPLEIPGALGELVDRASDDFRSQRVEFHLDPSMVIGVSTPLTDAYLETGCPDQGTLSGQEVDGG